MKEKIYEALKELEDKNLLTRHIATQTVMNIIKDSKMSEIFEVFQTPCCDCDNEYD